MTSSGNIDPSREITKEELAKRSSASNAWIAINGKVYDVTQYISRHPGGRSTIMDGVGKDATQMFNRAHSYVKAELVLPGKQVGVLKRNNLG